MYFADKQDCLFFKQHKLLKEHKLYHNTTKFQFQEYFKMPNIVQNIFIQWFFWTKLFSNICTHIKMKKINRAVESFSFPIGNSMSATFSLCPLE